MNFNNTYRNGFLLLLLFLVSVSIPGCFSSPDDKSDIPSAGRTATIEPDYSGIIIPPNIAPLNFSIKETGQEYFIKIHAGQSNVIRIQNSTGIIHIPQRSWKNLLAENRGKQLVIDVLVKNNSGQWTRFDPIVNQISCDSIDCYVTYRKFGPLYNGFKKMGIFQRCLENFDENTILLNRMTDDNCMNCHNFNRNKTDRWLLQLRGGPGTSMLLVVDGKARKIDTKTKINGPTAYPAWHPSGDLIAFSVSKLRLFFHETGECRDVIDMNSDIVLYDIPTNTITTTSQISDPDRMEIWPAWSPDGKYLYFCSAPKIETYENPEHPGEPDFDKIKYDLMRIAYDPHTRTWGKLETVISAAELGLSITEPRVSPDGRFLLFTGAAYGQFPIYLPSADVYVLNLQSGLWKKLESNSKCPDSFHSWSSKSNWIVFSSKRQDGVFTAPYFSYLDSSGHASKAFVLPQENPLFYESSLDVFNVPEFTTELIKISPQDLVKAAYSKQDAMIAKLDTNVIANRNLNTVRSSVYSQVFLKQNEHQKNKSNRPPVR